MLRAVVITVSDSASHGERRDVSGETAKRILSESGYEITGYMILPDDPEQLAAAMEKICDEDGADLIITTGGTGFSPRDHTPEATLRVIERQAPGIIQAMLFASLQITPRAMLGRGIAGIRGGTLIVNLPGSPKAVEENLSYAISSIGHGLEILRGVASDCARKE